MHIRLFDPADTESVVKLWNRCTLLRPWNNPYLDIERKCSVSDGLFLVGTDDASDPSKPGTSDPASQTVIIAAAMAGYDGHRGWVNYLAVEPSRQREGLGKQLMDHIEVRLLALGCPKLNLQVRAGNADVLAFYQRLGYSIDEAVSLGKRLIPDQ